MDRLEAAWPCPDPMSPGGAPRGRRWYPRLAAPSASRLRPSANRRPDTAAMVVSRSFGPARQALTAPAWPTTNSTKPPIIIGAIAQRSCPRSSRRSTASASRACPRPRGSRPGVWRSPSRSTPSTSARLGAAVTGFGNQHQRSCVRSMSSLLQRLSACVSHRREVGDIDRFCGGPFETFPDACSAALELASRAGGRVWRESAVFTRPRLSARSDACEGWPPPADAGLGPCRE